MSPKIAIVYYSTWGHVAKLAHAEAEGIKAAGGTADLFQIQETLSAEVLAKMHAPSQEACGVPILKDPSQLEAYDAFLFGIPTRLGNFPAQWRTFWDLTGKQWFASAFWGKYAGLFVATGGQGGGQESTALASMSTLAHHGMIYVPLGYKTVFSQLTDLSEAHGGSPWGAGALADNNGSRQPSPLELEIAREQGKAFYGHVSRVSFG